MKFIVAASTIITAFTLTSTAHAILDTPGRFIASQCGEQQVINEVTPDGLQVRAVCIGTISGESKDKAEIIEFKKSDNSSEIFRITQVLDQAELPNNEGYSFTLQLESSEGRAAVLETVRSADGSWVSANGKFEETDFSVPEFRQVLNVF